MVNNSSVKQTKSQTEEIVILLTGVIVVGALIRNTDQVWALAGTWAITHGVAVTQSADPLIPIPGWAGAGLDTGRAALVAALLLAVAALAVGGGIRVASRGGEPPTEARSRGRRGRR